MQLWPIHFASQPSQPGCPVPAPGEVRGASGPSAPAYSSPESGTLAPPSHFLPSLTKVQALTYCARR